MRKVQITIAIYILIVLVISVFFMPMNRMIIYGVEDKLAETVRYRPFWETTPQSLDNNDVDDFYYVYDIQVYKFHLSIISLVFLSIIAIQAIGFFKQLPISIHIHKQRTEDND